MKPVKENRLVTGALKNFNLWLFVALFLSGCGSDSKSDSGSTFGGDAEEQQALLYTFPRDEQVDVAAASNMMIRFSQPLNTGGSDFNVSVAPQGDATNPVVLTRLPSPEDALLYRMHDLEEGQTYRAVVSSPVEGGSLIETEFTFTVASSGPKARQNPEIVYSEFTSTAETSEPIITTSSFHFIFSEDMDPATLTDEHIRLLDGSGNPVALRLYSLGHRLSIDPVERLTADGDYRLTLSGLTDLAGEPLGEKNYAFTPRAIAPTSALNLNFDTSRKEWTQVRLQSTLLGQDLSAVDGGITTELANPGLFSGVKPFFIPAGTQLTGSELDIKLGGTVPSRLETGNLAMTILNDSSGYIRKNSLLGDLEGPTAITTTMDIGVDTRNAITNALVSQQLLGVQMSGMATEEDGKLFLELAGSAELTTLDNAVIGIFIHLHLESSLSAGVEQQLELVQAPEVVAVYPGERQADVRTDEKIELLFNKSIDPHTLAGQLSLIRQDGGNQPVPLLVSSNGSKVTLAPREPLVEGSTYRVDVTNGVRDLNGNFLVGEFSSEFSTVSPVQGDNIAPMLTAVYPGVPCVLTDSGVEFAGSDIQITAGRCVGREANVNDDLYPQFTLAANRRVEIYFSKDIDPETLLLAADCNGQGSIRIEEVDWSGGQPVCVAAVAGSLEIASRKVEFTPSSPWQEGKTYRLVLDAGQDGVCAANEICGRNGLPLNTAPLAKTSIGEGGGGAIAIPFRGTAPLAATYRPVFTLPLSDLDADGAINGNESVNTSARITFKMDLCDANSCTNPFGLLSEPVCDAPGDPAPRDEAYTCNPDSPRTRLNAAAPSFAGDNFSYVTAFMPLDIGVPNLDGLDSGATIPVDIPPAVISATGLDLNVNAVVNIPVSTGQLLVRLRQVREGDTVRNPRGEIYASEVGPRFRITLQAYLDAPYLEVPTGGDHNMKSLAAEFSLDGPIRFSPDGRLLIDLTNPEPIKIAIEISGTLLQAADGEMVLEIPAGGFSFGISSDKPTQTSSFF